MEIFFQREIFYFRVAKKKEDARPQWFCLLRFDFRQDKNYARR